MCGIAGACWSAHGKSVSEDEMSRMLNAISHRGPDDSGIFNSAIASPTINGSGSTSSAANVLLGHRRLSIIDLAGGHQPLSNADKSIWIAFNGEIYNYQELRADLEAEGYKFQTHSDTETIIHLYHKYGEECVSYLRGMFAFAIWDDRQKQLFIARDRLGQKPLFYREEQGRLLFSSELKALLQLPDMPRDVDPTAIDDYLTYLYVPNPRCILKGFQKLPPAHSAIYRDGKLKVQRYWHPPYEEAAQGRYSDPNMNRWTVDEWRRELRKRLTESVRLRMRSDVPLGAFLSGGIDSTIIVGLMQELAETPVHSFSIGFPIKDYDETSFAEQAAQHLKTNHHQEQVDPDALSILPQLVWQYDEPFADSSAIPTMALSKMTRQHVTVSLSGDGGDELFAGYNRYRAVQLASYVDRCPAFLRKPMLKALYHLLPNAIKPKSKLRQLKQFVRRLNQDPKTRYLQWISTFDGDMRHNLYADGFRSQLAGHDSAEFLMNAYAEAPSSDIITATTCADLLTYLPCDILTKVDIASMAYSLECRSPFLDHHVVELAAEMPLELKLSRKSGKQILIDTFSDLLPDSIQYRPKMGFGVPLAYWFRKESKALLHDIILSPTAINRGYFSRQALEEMVNEHVDSVADHSSRLWTLLCLEMWHQTYIDSTIVPSSAPGGG